MRVVALDFETYYDAEYSLSQMTTEAYLRDPRFEVICVTATVNDGAVLEAWGYEGVKQLLISLELERAGTITVAHNARFDGSIIEWVFGIRVNFLVCTILMMRETGLSRLISESLDALAKFLTSNGYNMPHKGDAVKHAKGLRLEAMGPTFRAQYGAYCRVDTLILRAAAYIMLPLCPTDALRTINMTLQMYTRPVFELDKALLNQYLIAIREKREAALLEMAVANGHVTTDTFLKQLRSKPKFAALLQSVGVSPPMKVSEKKTAKARLNDPEAPEVMDYAFAKDDLEFKEMRDHPNPKVAALVMARMENNTSQAESRTLSFLAVANPMPIPLQYAKAHTSRYGGDEKLNVQNLPKRNGDKTLRTSMMAPEGFEVGGADSSQVEARLLAYAAQETELLTIFETGGDPYAYMGETIYNEPAATIKKYAKLDVNGLPNDHPDRALHQKFFSIRNVGKETILGSGYQMSGAKFATRLQQIGIMLKPSKSDIHAWALGVQRAGGWPADKDAQGILFNEYLLAYHVSEAKRINQIYRGKHTSITRFWRTCEWVLSQLCQGNSGHFGGPDGKLFRFDGKHKIFGKCVPAVRLPDGFWIVYPGLRTFVDDETGYIKYSFQRREGRNMVTSYIYGGSLTENLIQGLAFAVLKWQAVRIHKDVPVKMNVHDEWMSVYRIEDRERIKEIYMAAMRAVPPWVAGAPLNCEFTHGKNYGEC